MINRAAAREVDKVDDVHQVDLVHQVHENDEVRVIKEQALYVPCLLLIKAS